jgi:hypothetical protein
VIQARAAADAEQRLALSGIGENLGAAVVEKDDIKFVGPVRFSGLACSSETGCVDRQRLTGSAASQKFQENGQILRAGNQLLNAGEGDVNAGRGTGQPGVALIFHQHDGAGIGNQKIRAGNADTGRQKFFAQRRARHGGETFRRRVRRSVKHVGHLLQSLVQRGRNDVVRSLAGELDDIFAQVRFHRLDAIFFEMLVQMNLFRGHRFGLHHQLHAALAGEIGDELARLGAGVGPDHFAAAGDHVALEFLEINIQMIERVLLEVVSVLAQILVVRQSVRNHGLAAIFGEAAGGGVNRELELGIG